MFAAARFPVTVPFWAFFMFICVIYLSSKRTRKRRVRDAFGNWCDARDLEGQTYEVLGSYEAMMCFSVLLSLYCYCFGKLGLWLDFGTSSYRKIINFGMVMHHTTLDYFPITVHPLVRYSLLTFIFKLWQVIIIFNSWIYDQSIHS